MNNTNGNTFSAEELYQSIVGRLSEQAKHGSEKFSDLSLGLVYASAIQDAVTVVEEEFDKAQEAVDESNKPLAAKELLGMEGEPVWWVNRFGKSGWGLVSVHARADEAWLNYGECESLPIVVAGELYDRNVKAIYRRKPGVKEDA